MLGLARCGGQRRGSRRFRHPPGLWRQLGQTKVQNLRLAAIRHENVRRLDVPMDDPLRVRGLERVGDLDGEVKQFVRLERLARNAMLQGLSLQQLHRDEGLAFVLVDVVNRADVGMVERGRRLRFPLESFQSLPVPGEFCRQKLQGHSALQLAVLGLVHYPHAPAAQLLQDAVVGNRPAQPLLIALDACA